MFSALVLGSIAPDLPHLLFLNSASRFGHTLLGLFLVSVPAGFLGLILFHCLLKRPLLALAPDSIRLRIPPKDKFPLRPVTRVAWILLSILIGVLTHIIWDGFVKSHGLLATNWPHWYCMRNGTLFCRALMPVSSLGGLAVIGIACVSWMHKTGMSKVDLVSPIFTSFGRLLFYLFTIMSAVGFGLLYQHIYTPFGEGEDAIAASLFGGMAAGFWIVLIFSIWWHVRGQEVGSEVSGISE